MSKAVTVAQKALSYGERDIELSERGRLSAHITAKHGNRKTIKHMERQYSKVPSVSVSLRKEHDPLPIKQRLQAKLAAKQNPI